jgi:L-asparaginase II
VVVARTMRAGIAEAWHHGSAVAVDREGTVLFSLGETTFPIYYRSAIKPFQATASLRAGADLVPEHLALACASHGGQPAHVAIVRAMLHGVGVTDSALRCPASWPLSPRARDRLIAAGANQPRPLFHNCSGKHAGFLRACVQSGWSTADYLAPDHPLQRSILEIVADATGADPHPLAVDGCGAPVLAGTIEGLATGFARLSVDPQFRPVATAMTRYPALVADSSRPDGRLAAWWGGPLKVGAQGLVAASRSGVGIAVKSHEGSRTIAVLVLMAVMDRLGLMPDAARAALEDVARPAVHGGGRRVGFITPASVLVDLP